jgi:hypothetical protein
VLVKTMTMMALMLVRRAGRRRNALTQARNTPPPRPALRLQAPAYKSFGPSDFNTAPSVIAAILFVIVAVASYLLVSYFRRINAVKQAESIAKKKEADRKYLAAGGATAVAYDGGAGAGSLGDAPTTSLLGH